MFSLKEIIAIAVQIERNGEDIYRSARKRNPSEELGALLSSLSDEEGRHAELFEQMGRGAENSGVDGALDKMARIMLQATMEESRFSLNEADLSRVDQCETVLEAAIEFEKDTVAFYDMLRAFVLDDNALASLDRIIEEEKKHVADLTAQLEKSAVLQR